MVELFLVLRFIFFCAVVILLSRDQCLGGGLDTIYCLNSDLITKAQLDNILQPSIKAVIVTLQMSLRSLAGILVIGLDRSHQHTVKGLIVSSLSLHTINGLLIAGRNSLIELCGLICIREHLNAELLQQIINEQLTLHLVIKHFLGAGCACVHIQGGLVDHIEYRLHIPGHILVWQTDKGGQGAGQAVDLLASADGITIHSLYSVIQIRKQVHICPAHIVALKNRDYIFQHRNLPCRVQVAPHIRQQLTEVHFQVSLVVIIVSCCGNDRLKNSIERRSCHKRSNNPCAIGLGGISVLHLVHSVHQHVQRSGRLSHEGRCHLHSVIRRTHHTGSGKYRVIHLGAVHHFREPFPGLLVCSLTG